MNQTPESPHPSPAPAEPSRRRFFTRAAVVALLAGLATAVGWNAFAHGGPGGWHRGRFLRGPLDPAALDAHLDRMLRHLYVEIDATDAQKTRLEPIVKAAARDLLPLRQQMHTARRQAVELLTKDPVDRAALEALRASQLRLAEQGSARLVQALADVADVLTPDQRVRLAERFGRWHGSRG